MMNLFTLPDGTVVNLFKAISVSAPIHRSLYNKFVVCIYFDGQSEEWEYDLCHHKEETGGLDSPPKNKNAAYEQAKRIHADLIACWAE